MNTFGWRAGPEDQWKFDIDTPEQVLILICLTAQWLDKERWENEGSSIWSYEEIKPVLIRDILNFSIIYGYMKTHPDIYLVFYDSY